MSAPIVLNICEITKRFPGVTALERVSFDLKRGEVHALLGENGAGKSTLLKILTGVFQPDSGVMHLQGQDVRLTNPRAAHAAGITFVPQDVVMVPKLSVGRNVLLGLERAPVARDKLSGEEHQQVAQAFATIGLTVDPQAPAGELSVAQMRLAQISRCFQSPGEVVLLDEPTAALSEQDALHLLENLEKLRGQGKAIVYVTHRLSEIMRLADRVTVLRDGRVVAGFHRPFERASLVEAMSKSHSAAHKPAVAPMRTGTETILEARGVSVDRWLEDVSLSVKAGTVVGIAGVQGSGHGQLLWALARAMPRKSGTVRVKGAAEHDRTIRSMYRAGVLLVPADRRRAAIVPQRSVADNIAVSDRAAAGMRRNGFRRLMAETQLAQKFVERFDIRPRNPAAKVGLLSGGNQQKVAIARAIASKPAVLLVEEPTQGIDINAKAEVHALLRRTAAETGCAVIVASSEFEELIELCSTIHVMRLGRLVHTFEDHTPSYRDILEHAIP